MRSLTKSQIVLICLLLCAVVHAESQSRHPSYELMLEAAQKAQRASREIYLTKYRLGIVNSKNDINRTGLVGEEFTPLTTTPGYLAAKRTATNPDFAGYLTRLLQEHGLSQKDSVLVTMTGSLPGLNLNLICALETLGVPSLRIASLGASSYGANQLEMTWIDMEDVLVREGLLNKRSDLVTLGGTGDVGGGLSAETLDFLRKRCARLGYRLLDAGNRRAQYEERQAAVGNPQSYSLLINVGGNHLMLGTGPEGRELPGGYIRPDSKTWEKSVSTSTGGLVFDFLAAGVPVLNLLQVEELAQHAGIPVDPSPLPRLGTSPVYFLEKR